MNKPARIKLINLLLQTKGKTMGQNKTILHEANKQQAVKQKNREISPLNQFVCQTKYIKS
jgi:hypothetical protein